MEKELHPMFQRLLGKTDDWPGANPNESTIDYNFLTRHPTLSTVFICVTGFAVIAGTTGNILVSQLFLLFNIIYESQTQKETTSQSGEHAFLKTN